MPCDGFGPFAVGNRHPTIVPYETLPASDGDVVVAIGNDTLFRRFCEVIGLGELADDSRFSTNRARVESQDTLRPILIQRISTRSKHAWISELKEAGIPCGAVRDLLEVLSDPQLIARTMVVPMEHPSAGTVRLLGLPVKLGATPGAVRTPPPRLGEHTGAVLAHDLSLGAEEIDVLRGEGVI